MSQRLKLKKQKIESRNMKLKSIKCIGLCLAVAAGLGSAANAQIVYYTWVPGSSPDDSSIPSSGMLELNGTTVVSLTFTDGSEGTWSGFSGSAGILGDNDAILLGNTVGPNSLGLVYPVSAGPLLAGTYVPLAWTPNGIPTAPDEQNVQDTVGLTGDWVPVPEPATLISGALLLLPFGASTLRILRRNSAV